MDTALMLETYLFDPLDTMDFETAFAHLDRCLLPQRAFVDVRFDFPPRFFRAISFELDRKQLGF